MNSLFFLFFAIFGSGYGLNQTLNKRYTIRFPMILPVGGRIIPLGEVCTESMDLLLNRVNSQSKILNDYNVVVDVIDDKCLNFLALKKLLPELENWMSVSTVGYNAQTYAASLPRNPEIKRKSANTTYTPPLFFGSICAAVCKVIASLAPRYDLLEVSTACIDPILDDNERYPNYYRFYRPLVEWAKTRKALSTHLGLSRVGILSDASQFTYNDVLSTVRHISEGNSNVAVAAEEFFQTDPSESVSRLKNQDIRIIFAMCFVKNCPAVACAAYNLGYYGSNMVWVFTTAIDLVSEHINRPRGCDKSMTDKFAEGVLFIGPDLNSATLSSEPSETGITGDQIADHLRSVSPASANSGQFGWRLLCFETLNNAINIANKVEQVLNSKNETLANVIADPSRKGYLKEEFRNAILSVEFQATWGPMKMGQGHSVNNPPMIIQQLQYLKRVLVLVENVGKLIPYKENNFMWRTSDGNPPKNGPSLTYQAILTPTKGTFVSWCLSSIMLFALTLSILISAKTHNPEIAVVMVGGLLLVIANILFTDEVKINSKCAVIVSLIFIGYSIILGIVCFKAIITFVFRSHSILIDARKRNQAVVLSFSVWFAVNLVLVLVMMFGDFGKPNLVAFEKKGEHKPLAENITIYHWKACSADDFILGYVIIGIQALLATFGVFCGLITRHQQTAFLMRDLANVRICLFIIFPLTMALLMVQLVVEDNLIIFILINLFSLGTGLILVALFAIPKITLVPQELPVLVSAPLQTAASRAKSRRSSAKPYKITWKQL